MTFEEALEILKRGGEVARDGRTFRIGRGVEDVTNLEEAKRVYFDEDDRAADNWEVAQERVATPDVIAPETVDEALAETQEES